MGVLEITKTFGSQQKFEQFSRNLAINDAQEKALLAAEAKRFLQDEQIKIAIESNKHKIPEIKAENWDKPLRYGFFIQEFDPIRKTLVKSPGVFGFFLRIQPSNLSVSTQFATNVVATNRGILEEHNGFVFKTITLSGTTGVLPNKKTQKTDNGAVGTVKNTLRDILPGATDAAESLVRKVVGNKPPTRGDPTVNAESSGYAEFQRLSLLFHTYVELKKEKTDFAKKAVLVFSAPKDNASYLCTPISFESRRDSTSPLLYRYNIVLRSWAISQDTPPPESVFDGVDVPSPDRISVMKDVTNLINDGRDLIQGAGNVLRAVNSDFTETLSGINRILLVGKDITGISHEIADSAAILKSSADQLGDSFKNVFGGETGGFAPIEKQPVSPPSGRTSLSASEASQVGKTKSPGGEDRPIQSAAADNNKSLLLKKLETDPALLKTSLSDLDLPSDVQAKIDAQIADALATTAGQVRQTTQKVQDMSDNHASAFGMMDETYAKTFRLPHPIPTDRKPTEDDILTSVAMQETKQASLSMLATGEIFKEKEPDPFVAANAILPDVDQVTAPQSTFPVAVPKGATLEQISQEFLGDAARHREIAILNRLRSPYIDEDGFTRPISSASGRSFVVASKEDLAIGQAVSISGNLLPTTRRRILDIQEIGLSQFRVVVDGKSNLSTYTPGSSPEIQTRLPGTVGSGDTILIPDPKAPAAQSFRQTPLSETLSSAEKVFRVDLALSQTGDVAVGAEGDAVRSFGYQNATQSLRLMLETERGELERHINHGLALVVGQRSGDFSITDIESLVRSQIEADPRFVSADVNATLDGNVIRVSVVAEGAHGTGSVPVTFEIGAASV